MILRLKDDCSMFNEIENTIIEVLRENLETVSKENIGVRKPDFKLKKNLPAVSVANVEFKAEEIGLGRSADLADKEMRETYSGDGGSRSFTFSRKPSRPVLLVEHPVGRRLREELDYVVDYEKGVVTFHSPPREGVNNIMVKYQIPLETKGLKLNLRYYINVWSRDEIERDKIAVDIIKALLKEEEAFNRKGILIKPIGGFNTPLDEAPPEILGKSLEYLIESYLQVEIPVPRIEKIEIEEKKV